MINYKDILYQSVLERSYSTLFPNNYSKTTAYDSSTVLKLFHLMHKSNIFQYGKIHSILGTQEDTDKECQINYDKQSFRNFLLPLTSDFIFVTSTVNFVICGDFGADHDDIEALIMICNICKKYPENYKIIGITCSNLCDKDGNPINYKCINIAKRICEEILGPNQIIFCFENVRDPNNKKYSMNR